MNRKSTANPARIKFHYYLFYVFLLVLLLLSLPLKSVWCICVYFFASWFFGQRKKKRTEENMSANIHIRMNKWMCRLHHHHRRRRVRRTTYIKRLNLRPFFSADSIAFARLRFPFVRLLGCSIAVESATHLLFSSFSVCSFYLFTLFFFFFALW